MALDFLILYEHIVREYESLLLLKTELEHRGYTVEIRQLLDRKKLRYFTYKKPKVLVASCLYDNDGLNSHVYNNIGKCNKVVNLHWEQMLSDTQENSAWFNFAGNTKKCVQTCWGAKTQARLIAHNLPEKNCPVTGAIMMDFLLPQFNGYYKTKQELCEQFSLDPTKKMLLYISSFGYASMDEKEIGELSEMAGEDFSGFAKTNRISMAQTLEWFDKYLTENPDAQIIYRRHPSEWNSESLSALAKKHTRFRVIFEYSVKQWILAADQIGIWMSTAIAEIYFANKNCHILRPIPIEHQFDPVIYKNGKYIENYNDFSAAIESENTDFPIDKKTIEGYFDKSDTPSYIRTADLLENVFNNPPRDTPFDGEYKPHFNIIKCFALIGVHIMYALKLHPTNFKKISPAFADFAGRIYGYIDKAYISKTDALQLEQKIKKFMPK